MSLNPKITKDSAGMYWLEWTPDSTAEGYGFTTPGGSSRTFDPTRTRTRLGKNLTEPVTASVGVLDVTKRSPESATYPSVVTPPTTRTPLPPVGPFREEQGDHFYRDGDGLKTEKLFVTKAPGYGIANMRWNGSAPVDQTLPPASTGNWEVRDCKAKDVSASPPRVMDGTGECGFWVGEKTLAERVEVWNCAWMNMVTLGNCKGSRFYDLDLHDNPHVGLYMEHGSTDLEFHRCNFGGPRLGIQPDSSSINVEWWYQDGVYSARYPGYNGRAGSFNCKFIDCEIYCSPPQGPKPYEVNGAFLDAGTFGFEFIRCRFYGPGNALGFPNKLADASKPNKVIDCVFDNGGRKEPSYHDNAIG
jgi:hypothetical protein